MATPKAFASRRRGELGESVSARGAASARLLAKAFGVRFLRLAKVFGVAPKVFGAVRMASAKGRFAPNSECVREQVRPAPSDGRRTYPT